MTSADSVVEGIRQALKVFEHTDVDSTKLTVTTNGDVADLATPLSRAALVARFVGDDWP